MVKDEPTQLAVLPTTERWWHLIWGGLLAYGVAHVVLAAVLRFPTDWDTLMYHRPLLDQWLQARSLYALSDAHWFNPGTNELLGLWTAAPFSGDFLVGLLNLPAAVLLGLAVVELGAVFGLGRPLTHLAGFMALSSWPIWRQLSDAENDLAVSALFLASLCYTVRWIQDRRLANLYLASLCLGLLTGVKYYALGYAAVIALNLMCLGPAHEQVSPNLAGYGSVAGR